MANVRDSGTSPTADFDQNYTPLNAYQTGIASGLKEDSLLGCKIAQAKGPSGDTP